MAIISCKECHEGVSDTAERCPHCGTEVPGPKIWPWVVGIPAAILTVFLMIGAERASSPEGKARSKARAAISYCWEQQDRKSLSLGSQQFIAGACEQMEQEFMDKYGVSP